MGSNRIFVSILLILFRLIESRVTILLFSSLSVLTALFTTSSTFDKVKHYLISLGFRLIQGFLFAARPARSLFGQGLHTVVKRTCSEGVCWNPTCFELLSTAIHALHSAEALTLLALTALVLAKG